MLKDIAMLIRFMFRVQLNSDGSLKSSTVTSLAERSGTDAIEASAVYPYNGYFYLFTSWDKCCDGQYLSFLHVEMAFEVNVCFVT